MLNVKDCGAVGDGITDDTAAIQTALDHGGRVHFPAGDYRVAGLRARAGTNLSGAGFHLTRLVRTEDIPVLTAGGGVAQVHETPAMYGIVVEDLGIHNAAPGSTTPLVDLRGSSACQFSRVKLESYTDGAPLLQALQVWDTRFNDVMFHGGGSNTSGVGAVRLLADVDGYRQTKETFFQGCWWESYRGPAIEFARGGAGQKPQMIHFTDCKLESRHTTTEHIRLHANTVHFSGVYLTHELTAGPIVDMVGARGVYGDLRFYQIQSDHTVTPSALVNIDAGCRYMALDIHVTEPQKANVVTLANPSDPTIELRISAEHPTVNGTQSKVHTLPYSTVKQSVNAATGACQYVWARDGHPHWSLGNPSSHGAAERFHLRANNTDYLTFQSDGPDPATSARRITVNAMLTLGSAWNSSNLLRLGDHALWVDQSGALRMKRGVPGSDTDGTVVGS